MMSNLLEAVDAHEYQILTPKFVVKIYGSSKLNEIGFDLDFFKMFINSSYEFIYSPIVSKFDYWICILCDIVS